MPPFLAQARPQMPGNADLTNPLMTLGDTIYASRAQGRENEVDQAIGNAIKGGDLNQLMQVAGEYGRTDTALNALQMQDQRDARASAERRANARAGRAQANADRNFALQEREFAEGQRQFDLEYDIKKTEADLKALEAEAAGNFDNPDDRLKYEQDVRQEYTRLTGDYRKRADAITQIRSNAKNVSPISGVALVFNFMKMLDPPSTVREGEQETLKKARGVLSALGVSSEAVDAAVRGDPLTTSQRQEIVDVANAQWQGLQRVQAQVDRRFDDIADAAGVDRDIIRIPLGGEASGDVIDAADYFRAQ